VRERELLAEQQRAEGEAEDRHEQRERRHLTRVVGAHQPRPGGEPAERGHDGDVQRRGQRAAAEVAQ
jgi:hypothetical protein